jgi:hypothetical protein
MPVSISHIFSNQEVAVSTLTLPQNQLNSGEALLLTTTQDQLGNTVSSVVGGDTSIAALFMDRITGPSTVTELWYLGVSGGGSPDVTVVWSGTGKTSAELISLGGVGA